MKILTTLLATTMLTMSGGAFASDTSVKSESKMEYKDGGYESSNTSNQTTAGGTSKSAESSVDVDVDNSGRVDKTVKSESSVDPKGMMNRKKDMSETHVVEKERGGYKQTTTRKHKDADGTDITFKTVTEVDVDSEGKVTTAATTEKIVDPKGMMNSTKTKSKSKSVNGRVVENETKTY